MDWNSARRFVAPDEGTGGGSDNPPPEVEEAEPWQNVPPQVLHLTITALVLIVLFLVARSMLVPASFGQFGFYQGDAVAKHASKPMAHAGKEACKTCHPDKSNSPHVAAGVACESCHGPALKHVQAMTAGESNAPLPDRPSSRAFCGVCHQKLAGRPALQPQVDLATHNPTEKCIACHQIHPKQEVK